MFCLAFTVEVLTWRGDEEWMQLMARNATEEKWGSVSARRPGIIFERYFADSPASLD